MLDGAEGVLRRRSRRRGRSRRRTATARAARTDARGRVPGGGHVSTARTHASSTSATAATTARATPALGDPDTGRVHGPSRARARARRRHKVLPAITLVDRFSPALVSVAFAVLASDIVVRRPHLLRRLHVHHRQRARALRRARRPRGAVPGPAHRDARPLPRRAARPHPLSARQGRGRRGASCS